jgi:hypothetical protein
LGPLPKLVISVPKTGTDLANRGKAGDQRLVTKGEESPTDPSDPHLLTQVAKLVGEFIDQFWQQLLTNYKLVLLQKYNHKVGLVCWRLE